MILIDIKRELDKTSLAGLTKILTTEKKCFAVLGTDGSVRLQDRLSKDSTQKRYKRGTKIDLGEELVVGAVRMVLSQQLTDMAYHAAKYGYSSAFEQLGVDKKEYLRALARHLKLV